MIQTVRGVERNLMHRPVNLWIVERKPWHPEYKWMPVYVRDEKLQNFGVSAYTDGEDDLMSYQAAGTGPAVSKEEFTGLVHKICLEGM